MNIHNIIFLKILAFLQGKEKCNDGQEISSISFIFLKFQEFFFENFYLFDMIVKVQSYLYIYIEYKKLIKVRCKCNWKIIKKICFNKRSKWCSLISIIFCKRFMNNSVIISKLKSFFFFFFYKILFFRNNVISYNH